MAGNAIEDRYTRRAVTGVEMDDGARPREDAIAVDAAARAAVGARGGATLLYVPQDEARTVEALGARWNAALNSYAVNPRDAARFARWTAPSEAYELDPSVKPDHVEGRYVTANGRQYLEVRYQEKDYARELGARYDKDECAWYAPEGSDLVEFAEMLPSDHAFWGPRKELYVPAGEKEEAKARGAIYLAEDKAWYKPAGADEARFSKWARPAKRHYVEVDPSRSEDAKRMHLTYDPAEKKWWHREGQAPSGVEALAAPVERVYLNVPYEERAAAKSFGARWDPEVKQWYLAAGAAKDALAKHKEWGEPAERTYLNVLKCDDREALKAAGARFDWGAKRYYVDTDKMTPELARFAEQPVKHYLHVPYGDIAEAKKAGCDYDPAARSWYVRSGIDMAPFEKWTARSEAHVEAERDKLKPKAVEYASPEGFNDPIAADKAARVEAPQTPAEIGRAPKAEAEGPSFGTGSDAAQAPAAPAAKRPKPVIVQGGEKPKPPASMAEAATPKSDKRAFANAAQEKRLTARRANRAEEKAIREEFGR